MAFKIPFTRGSSDKLKKKSATLISFIKPKRDSKLAIVLKENEAGFSREEYMGIALTTTLKISIAVLLISTTILFFADVRRFVVFGLSLGLLMGVFIFGIQIGYPHLYTNRRQKNIERNLLPALEDMLVQLNAGVPLFTIMVNISSADYGELSNEFKRAVKKMNAGISQTEVLDEIGKSNPSPYFRRTLWQISNGMKAGSDIGIIIRESMKSLNQEQVLQIQTYGNKLNPLIMFYMLVSIILPALSITFLTILSSMVNLEPALAKGLFIGTFALIVIIQIMFIGIIKSTRPSLL